MNKRGLFVSSLLFASCVFISACTAAPSALTSKPAPTVTIIAPASNSHFRPGDAIRIQSNAIDPEGVAHVELAVDGAVIGTESSPVPQTSFTVIQLWTATPGNHLITVRARNTNNVLSDPAAIAITVAATEAPTVSPTPTPTPACLNNSVFITDVTVPDGTLVAPGQSLNKIWRVRNTGTCAWSSRDVLAFVGGVPMTTTTTVAVSNTAPGATADLLVGIIAPANPGLHSGSWRMRATNGAFFGPTLTVNLNVASPAPNCPFTPVIESFTASPTTITAGQSATLSWGRVLGAQFAEIDNDIGGVATPGSTTVTPGTTTTFTMTAVCGAKVKIAQVTITVSNPSPAPTLAPTTAITPTTEPTATPTRGNP